MSLKRHPLEVNINPIDPNRFREVLDGAAWEEFAQAIEQARELLQGRTVWNINSTAAGGGVAEMLRSLMSYACGIGVDTRWVAVAGTPDFFHVTKLLHNLLHGARGDGSTLGPKEHDVYEAVTTLNAEGLAPFIKPNDVVVLHDPQTAGMIQRIRETGASVIWRSHIGTETPDDCVRHAWGFLLCYVKDADMRVFSRTSYVPPELLESRFAVIAPSIDPFSVKNQAMDDATVRAILIQSGLAGSGVVANGTAGSAEPIYRLPEGGTGRVGRRAVVHRVGPPPGFETPLVVQVSRWDRLKDPVGVMRGFIDHVAEHTDAHLVLAGPNVEGVADDPEGAEVLAETVACWKGLSEEKRARVSLACLPMDDLQENAAIVNALQRHATVVVQKSLREGFGLTVTEAMWKTKPVVAVNIGGVSKQIKHEVSGLLIDDPSDLRAFGSALLRILQDKPLAERLRNEAHRQARDNFLHSHHLAMWVQLLAKLAAPSLALSV